MKMRKQLIFLLVEICLIVNALSFRESSDHTGSHISPLSSAHQRHEKIVDAPTKETTHGIQHGHWFTRQSRAKVSNQHGTLRPSSIALTPSMSSFGGSARDFMHGSVSSPTSSYHNHDHHHHHHTRSKFNGHAMGPIYRIHPPTYSHKGPSTYPIQSLFPPSRSLDLPENAPSPTASSIHYNMPIFPPSVSPWSSSLNKRKTPTPSSILALPPPPPNTDCSSITCTEPLTNTPPGSPCGCVIPIQVKLHLNVAIYNFFPWVTELAEEIAASVKLNCSQVRIMGADVASQQLEKTSVLINLVPRGGNFDYKTAFLIYEKFWHRQVSIKASLFHAYEVLYVHYPGLPPSPPAPSSISTIDEKPNPVIDNNGMEMKPLGVEVRRRKKGRIGRGIIAVIVLSSFTAFVICLGVVWLLLLKCRCQVPKPHDIPQASMFFSTKPIGTARSTWFSLQGSEPQSFSSGRMTYTGSAKTFSLSDIVKATDNFDASRILGEGGFGLVYSGILDDGKEVAVKILKRDDRHGGQEFLAEVEMLSRLHHRNLVKLIGICTEDTARCLVYELVPNGSVDSHLHGVEKETDPLDWDARMKIALGSARGLAYLHEDSNPRVIHRDFKSSNILLEYDFTPKVSDFGLARTALEEGNKHISTHVMGTFGYLAPEYAMTGHLLVKSDVYSYGVVLLELLTGRKPVDLSQPPGQENLVSWARPLLTSKEGLETLIDSAIKSQVSFDSVTKVAAIASMCVQPEVSHRPFMGEVVQALKLVCDEIKGLVSRSCSQKDLNLLVDADTKINTSVSDKILEASKSHLLPRFGTSHETKNTLSSSELLSASVGIQEQEFGSFRRHSSSGPIGTGRKKHLWQRLRSLSRGSMSEHGFPLKFWLGNR